MPETNKAYNAAEMSALHDELINPVDAERLNKAPAWTRSLVTDLVQRIYNLRHCDNCKRGAIRHRCSLHAETE